MKEAADKMSTVDQEHPEVLNSYPQEGTSVITSRFTSIARREYIFYRPHVHICELYLLLKCVWLIRNKVFI